MTPPFPSGSHPDVVEEHLEEAAFLYAQRLYLARTGVATWDRLIPIEVRFEAHLLGLSVAGPEVGEVVRPAVEAALPGAAHVATRLLCRSNATGHALGLVTSLDARRVGEGVDALQHDAPANWTDALAEEVASGEPRRVRVAAAVIGAHRLPLGPALLRALASSPDAGTASALIAALGALRYPPARSVLHRHLASDTEPAARRALLRFGDAQALRAALAGQSPAHVLDVALIGNAPHGRLLAAAALAGNVGAPAALGVLGDPAHVPLLLSLLDRGDAGLSTTAAAGLRVITGAPLMETVKVLDDSNEPEGDGDLLERISRWPDDWRTWWAENSGAFQTGVRYRAGQPFAPPDAVSSPVGGLADDLLPSPLRDALADELAGRYGLDAPFRASAFVASQHSALSALAGSASAGHGQVGAWTSPKP